MKRLNNLYQQIISIDNLRLADKKARRGKSKQPGVKAFDLQSETNLFLLHEMLLNKQYKTSEYSVFKVFDRKEREVRRLPYFPDRIAHHAVMNILEPIFVSVFTADSYSCIKGKGIHGNSFAIRKALKDVDNTTFCLQMDIKKFYENVDHTILKELLSCKIKDKDLLWLLFEIIDSAPGLPIGNYLSQYFANFYLTYFDHWLKETKQVKYYFRYCDDLVVLSNSKPYLHQLRFEITKFLGENLNLTVKQNYRVAPVSTGINVVGYVHYHTHTLLRKSIKKQMARAVAKNKPLSVASYYGWAKHCNSKNLLNKLNMTRFSELNIKPTTQQGFEGDKIDMYKILNKEVKVLDFAIKPSKYEEKGNGKCLYMQLEVDQRKRVAWCGSGVLMDLIQQVPKEAFPVTTTIVKENDRYLFT